MKNKKTMFLFLSFFIFICGTFATILVKQHIKNTSFTEAKWSAEPGKRFLIVKDMINKHDFAGMTKQQLLDMLGEPDGGLYGSGGFPVRASDRKILLDEFRNPNSICYFTKTGEMPEDYSGFYVQFDSNEKVVDYAIVYFTT